jgi:hypothetical protein
VKTLSTNTIAFLILIGTVGLMVYLFAESRNDPSLRIAALVSGTGLVSAMTAIASTILIGKDVTKHDLPPNSTTTDISTVKVGPVDPTQP